MFYWLVLLPMGFRLAVACAQAAMWLFLNFLRTGVDAATCIDNVCMSGEEKATLRAAHNFLIRVESCGFTLNGFEDINYTGMSEEDQLKKLLSLVEVRPEFLGELYDLKEKTRCMTAKTLGKLDLVWRALGPLLIGLLVYATQVLNLPTHNYFNIFKKGTYDELDIVQKWHVGRAHAQPFITSRRPGSLAP